MKNFRWDSFTDLEADLGVADLSFFTLACFLAEGVCSVAWLLAADLVLDFCGVLCDINTAAVQ